jgi:hypothetical protein
LFLATCYVPFLANNDVLFLANNDAPFPAGRISFKEKLPFFHLKQITENKTTWC